MPVKHPLFWLLITAWLSPALAETKTAIAGASPEHAVILSPGALAERVCWYQDQRYSPGARLKAGDSWLECTLQNELDTNGPLAWRERAATPAISEKKPTRHTLSVGQ